MKLLKKFKLIYIGLLLILVFFAFWVFKDLFISSNGSLYGNRLEGIDKVIISAKEKTSVTDMLKAKENIVSSKVNVHGKIIDILIYVDESMAVEDAKTISNEVLTKFSKTEKSFYDISFLISYSKKSSKTDFPIIGYKNREKDEIIW